MPYQNIPRFEPNYGNRYGFRQREVAPATGSVTQPVPGSPSAPPAPATIQVDQLDLHKTITQDLVLSQMVMKV